MVQVEQRLGTSKGGIETLKAHDWFAMVGLDWQKLLAKEVTTPGTTHASPHHTITCRSASSFRGSIPRNMCAANRLVLVLPAHTHLFAQANKRAAGG